jgi:hypothetical protein
LPGALLLAAQAFHSDPDLKLVTGQARIIDDQGEIIGELRSQFSSWEELVTNPRNSIRQISTFFSRSLFDELGLVDESLHIAMDMELLVRFTQHHSPLILDNYLTAYRTHTEAKTYTQIIKGYEESDRVRPKYFLNKTMASTYHKRSSTNWLSLSESRKFSLSERCICLYHAVQKQPRIIFNRGFWYSLKNIGSNFFHKTIPTEDA